MQVLEKTLRNKFEQTVMEARDIAETAAQAIVKQLGVGEPRPYPHLNDEEKELRRRLRIHGRQLGDIRDADKETQEVNRLIEEIAYEHWHRMLFARFLTENNLLMYPDPDAPVAISLEECEDLAAEEGATNGWELAARFAARMLPQIFRPDSPVFQLALPPEHQQKLERLVAALPFEVFTASDSLGWAYQFWQAKKKDEVNASEVKIGARELPAVTQLFTEPYMVSFLLDNSLGAWWAARRLTEADLKNAKSEEELRRKAAIPGVPLGYLRFVRQEDGMWTPAAGTFDAWPERLADLKAIDPCCGSGHFLVAAFHMLVPMRMVFDGLSAQEAADAVLRENIYGLELDKRCVELAAFALALAAWSSTFYYPVSKNEVFGVDSDRFSGFDRGVATIGVRLSYRPLPELNIACSGLSVSLAKEEWKQLGLGKKDLTTAMDGLYDIFNDAPVLGSLLTPVKTGTAKNLQWGKLSRTLEQALKQGQDEEQREVAIVAQGLAKAAALLAERYHWVITNVPYLARGKQIDSLRTYCEAYYSAAKNDLATAFLDRCLEFCVEGGTSSIVLPQNWLFLTTYKRFREKLLKDETWHIIARLGSGAFETISGEVVKAILITLSRGSSTTNSGGLFGDVAISNRIRGVDVSEPCTAAEKAAWLVTAEIKNVEQSKQLENPDARVTLDEEEDLPLLKEYADGLVGLQTGDDPMFIAAFWELAVRDQKVWEWMQATPDTFIWYAGQSWMVRWEEGKGLLLSASSARPTQGLKALGRAGLAIHRMGRLFPYHYGKERFHQNVATIIPHNPAHLPAIWCFCSSPEYNEAVRRMDQKLNVTNATLVKVPFDLERWTKVSEEQYPNGLPKPYTDDPTQWIFHGHPCGSVIWNEDEKWTAHGSPRIDETVLHVAVARLLGYRWPAELDADMDLADEQREWVKRSEALAKYSDEDGIVCIPPVRGEASASDRLLNLLAAAYGDAWSNDTLAALLKSVDHAGKTLETWLREKFFVQHCKLFQHRPFIWHIWDGLRDGFAALVNYHKLDAKLLETLTYTYLGDWISRQKQDIAGGVDGAQERLAAAEALKKKLELILEGEAPYDIFVRWKPLEKQPIGWNPDLNDGVRLNIRPFLTVPDIGKRGAGVLRDKPKPNINWKMDRGKDVASAPWYSVFKGDRINDHHLTLNEKRAAREAKKC